jgi:hypothetical protein
MSTFTDVAVEFPTAEQLKETSLSRRTANRDNGLRSLYENVIDGAVRNGSTSVGFNRYDMTDDMRAFLVERGYTVSDPNDETGTVIISWE